LLRHKELARRMKTPTSKSGWRRSTEKKLSQRRRKREIAPARPKAPAMSNGRAYKGTLWVSV